MVAKTRRKINDLIEEDGVDDILGLTQFEPHESDNSQTLWDVVAILKESGSKYKVQWAGVDPDTGEPWNPTWIPKEDCTDELIQEWKAQKRKRKGAKKSNRNTPQHQPSLAPSRARTRSNRSASLRESESTVVLENSTTPRKSLKSVIVRKRLRSSSTVDELPPATNSSMVESGSESHEPPRPHKKRRVVEAAHIEENDVPLPDYQEHDISPQIQEPNGRQKSSSRSSDKSRSTEKQSRLSQEAPDPTETPDSPQVKYGDSFQKSRENYPSYTPQKQKPSPTLRPIPQISPTVFRQRMEPPLSQIEQFSTPGSSHQHSRYSGGDATGSREEVNAGPEEIQPEPEMENAYDLIISPSRAHRIKPRRADKPWRDSSPLASSPSQSPYHTELMSALPFRQRSNTSLSLAAEQRADNLALILSAKDAVIVEMKQVIADREAEVASLNRSKAVLRGDVERLTQRIEDSNSEYTGIIRVRDERISRLIERLGGSGISNMLVSAPATPGNPPTSAVAALPPPYVRSGEDEVLISQLRVELEQARVKKAASDAMVAQLQQESAQERTENNTFLLQLREEVAHVRAEKAASDGMLEQARDVARRAEVAKMELAATERIAREVARNAPKIGEELYRNAKELAEAEAHKYKVQADLLLQQSSLTGDLLRRKAAKYDALLPKYQNLYAKHEQMFEDMVELENEREQLLAIMQTLRELVLQISQGTADESTYAQLAALLGELQDPQSGEEQEEEEQEDEELDADADADADEDMEFGDHVNPQPIVEERSRAQSYDGPDLGDPPTIFIEEIEEGPLGQSVPTVASPQSEKSDGMAFMCLWHPTGENETCQEHRATKQSLLNHIFKEHLAGL